MQHLKDKISSNNAKLVAINVDLQKGQEALETFIATINANVNKEMQTWAEMTKAAKAQAEYPHIKKLTLDWVCEKTKRKIGA